MFDFWTEWYKKNFNAKITGLKLQSLKFKKIPKNLLLFPSFCDLLL